MKLNIQASKEDLLELFAELDGETKDAILEQFTMSQIVDSVAKHLKGETDYWSWSTDGGRGGSELRKAISDIQGTESELKKDYESKLRSVIHDRDNYRNYYDWYFKIYHFENNYGKESLINYVERLVGKPKA